MIVIDGAKFEALALSPSRPYSLAVMLNSRQFQHEEGLQLGRLHTEFAYAGKAFKAGPAPDGAFFVEMFYEDAMEVFARLGANSLPYVFVVPPKVRAGVPRARPRAPRGTSACTWLTSELQLLLAEAG